MPDTAALADGTPTAAAGALAALAARFHAAPAAPAGSAAGAKAQLAALGSNPDWRAKFFNGDVAVRAEFGRLTALEATADPTGEALAGIEPSKEFTIETTVGNELNSRARADAVAGLREIGGLPDDVIKQIIDGHAVSGQEIAMARTVKAMRLSDEAFVARYMRGDLAARREMSLLATILSGEVA